MIYRLLNYFFFFFHTLIVLFNIFGWVLKKTRKWNLIFLTITAFSWFVLGIWYGWGYCFCTDWHYQVREHLGYHDQTSSYIHLLLLKATGKDFPLKLVTTITVIIFFFSFGMSIWLNIKDCNRKNIKKS